MIEKIDAALAGTGLFARGGFLPGPDDAVPPLPDGAPTATVILVGNAGGYLWQAFETAPGEKHPRHPLDRWMEPLLSQAADTVGAAVVFPNSGPPYVPIQDWAARAEAVYRSPIGIMIHPDWGLWHVYRAAFLFADKLDLPVRDDRPSPCDSCEKKPCLTVCPADAFTPEKFLPFDCADHVESAAGTPCRTGGCLARKACPVGRDHRYPMPAQAFHTEAMLRAVRRGSWVAD